MSSSRNRAIVRYTNEDTGDVSAQPSTSSSSKRQKKTTEATEVEVDDHLIDSLTKNCAKYLLITDKKIPIKRSDLMKTVAKQSLNRKTVDEIMNGTKRKLLEVFGIELIECPDANTVSYILVNKLPADGLSQAINGQSIPERQHLETGILTTVLAVIFMSGGTVEEAVVWKFLTRLGFDVSSKSKTFVLNDDSNGLTIRKLMTEVWVRQLYLKYQKIARSDPISHEFQWGFRAEREFAKMDVLEFVCHIFGDQSQPQDWKTQFVAAQKEMTDIGRPNDNEMEVVVE